MHACIAHLQQGLDTGLEDHVGVEQERAEQGLGVTGQLGHQPRQLSLGAVPHHHLALSVKGLTYSSNS